MPSIDRKRAPHVSTPARTGKTSTMRLLASSQLFELACLAVLRHSLGVRHFASIRATIVAGLQQVVDADAVQLRLWIKSISRTELSGSHVIPIALTLDERNLLTAARTRLNDQNLTPLSTAATLSIAIVAFSAA